MCDFQKIEYFITTNSSNSTWSSDLILITNTSKEVEVIQSGFEYERDYIVVVTVVTEFTSISSSANISELFGNNLMMSTFVSPCRIHIIIYIFIRILVLWINRYFYSFSFDSQKFSNQIHSATSSVSLEMKLKHKSYSK